ncbi:MAG TPA: TadE family protein, partial [Candidatus Sulfotelmatobacter sp.]
NSLSSIRRKFAWLRSCSKALARDSRGSEIAEAAMVLPLMFMMLLGIFWFGQAFRIYGTLTHAARQGARAGASPYCSTCASVSSAGQNAYTAIQSALAAANLDSRRLAPPTTPPALFSCNDGSTPVTCDPTPSSICVQRDVKLSSSAGTTGAGVCGISVSFQYPYQFWFPGTSLNQQLLQLHGVGRARMETK